MFTPGISVSPNSPTEVVLAAMSAFPPKADKKVEGRRVPFGPEGDTAFSE